MVQNARRLQDEGTENYRGIHRGRSVDDKRGSVSGMEGGRSEASPTPSGPYEYPTGDQSDIKNPRRHGADNRRQRPTTSERYAKTNPQGTESYRGITPQIEQKKAANATTPPQAESAYAPSAAPTFAAYPAAALAAQAKNKRLSALSIAKKAKLATTSVGLLSFGWIPYAFSVLFVLISWVGIGLSIMGEEAVNGVWLIGDWLAGYAGQPGIVIWAVFHILAMIIQLLLLLLVIFVYTTTGVRWYMHLGCYYALIFALTCSIAPILQIIPGGLIFMWVVFRSTK